MMSSGGRFGFPSACMLIGLILAAILGNYLVVTFFFRIDFLFGSIATLLVLRLYGLRWGSLTAIIASAYTYLLWNHPYSILIFTLEVLFVGLLLNRKSRNMLVLDGIYWMLIGMPLVWIFYAWVMGMDSTAVGLIMVKQSVNGMFNTLIATLILVFTPLRKWARDPVSETPLPLSQILFTPLTAMVFLPILTATIIEAQFSIRQITSQIETNLEETRRGVAHTLQTWIIHHQQGVAELARQASRTGWDAPEELQHATTLLAAAFPDFHNMYIANAAGTTVAFYPPVNERGESTIGLNFSDREYFHKLKETRHPILSDVFLGRGGVFSPIVIIGIPILDDDAFRGYALGAVKLDRLSALLEPFATKETEIMVVDKDRRIIVGRGGGPHPQNTETDAGIAILPLDGSSYWEQPEGRLPAMIRWKKSFYVKQARIGEFVSWELLLKHSIAPHRNILYTSYTQNFLVALLFAWFALLVARFAGTRIAWPIANLASLTSDLPPRLSKEGTLSWPQTQVLEVHALIQNFKQMVHTLSETFEKLRENEDRYRKVIALSKGVIYERDFKLNAYTFLGDEIEDLTGYRPDEMTPEVFDSLISEDEIITPQVVPSVYTKNRLWGILEDGWYVFRANFKITTTKGAVRWLSDHAVHVQDENEQIIKSLGILQDITRDKDFEQKVRQQDQLVAVGQLAAGIAHDFNNLLSVIMGVAQLLAMRKDLPPQVREDLRLIFSQGQRAAQMIRQILDFSRRTVARRQAADLGSFLKENVKLLSRTIPENIRIVTEVINGDHTIEANLPQLQQALTNLAVNARDAMPNGGQLRFRLSHLHLGPSDPPPAQDLPPGHWIILEVTDTGTGISPETLEHIYDPFFTTKPPGQGTGLGLAQVYGIVKQHGGEIAVRSAEGQGTTFSLFFPAARSAEHPPPPPDALIPKGNGETILLVEDQPEVMRIARAILENLGYDVITATNGQEALEVYGRNRDRISLVLTDVVMPEMGGRELGEALRQQAPGLPVVFMSGYPLGTGEIAETPAHIAGSVEKPLSLEQLAKTVARALRRPRREG